MHVIVYDYETAYSSKEYTLSKMSAIDYVRDPRFHALMVGISIDGAPAVVYEHDDIPAALAALELHKPDRLLIGHNSAGFDNLITSEVYGIKPALMTDTMHMMRWVGISRVAREQLASLAKWCGVGQKGTGTVMSDGKYRKEDFTSQEWEDFKSYCASDVDLTAACARIMMPHMTAAAIQFSSITSRMATEPVFWINPLPLHQFIADLDAKAEQTRAELQRMFRFGTQEEFIKAIRSADKFCAMLRAVGAEPPMKVSEAKSETKRKQMEEQGLDTSDRESWTVWTPALAKGDLEFAAMLDDPDERVRQLVQARMEHNTSVPRSRAEALLHMGEYMKPVPVMLKCFYAHTSRYGAGTTEGKSDGTQFQNLAKHNKAMKPLRQSIVVPEGETVIAADSSQIEARVLAYAAGEHELLDHFRHKRDPYAELASKFGYGKTAKEIHDGAKSGDYLCKTLRQAGKRLILSCWEADTEVLTNTGWKPIVTVSETDKLWDGEEWVQHQGLTSNGVKPTVLLGGTNVTPDHLIFDGTSWNTVGGLLKTPCLLNRAKRYGASALLTLPSEILRSEKKCFIWLNAVIAGRESGGQKGLSDSLLKPAVRTVRLVMQRICESLFRVIQITHPAQKSESLPSYARSVENVTAGCEWNDMFLFNVHAAQNLIGCCLQTYIAERLHDAMSALKRNLQRLSRKTIAAMRIYAQIQSIVDGCLIGLRRAYLAAITRMTGNTFAMEGEGFVASFPLDENTLHTCLRCRGGIIQNSTSTASTMMGTMHRGICGLLPTSRTQTTGEQSRNYKQNSTNCVPVYDIKNAGPRHRYVVRTKLGDIYVCHNCGYGTGPSKLADTLIRDKAILDPDRDKHRAKAKELHQMYRASNPNIVAFWRTCQQVVEGMAAGAEGWFGGPHNDLFHYGMMPICGRDPVPSIMMPTGYILRYPNLHMEVGEKRAEFFYDRPLGKNMVKTRLYSGALTENLIQCLAFQILMYQANLMDSMGVRLACNIHDSFATVVPDADVERTEALMLKCMKMVPPWVEGLPLDAEAETATDFTIV